MAWLKASNRPAIGQQQSYLGSPSVEREGEVSGWTEAQMVPTSCGQWVPRLFDFCIETHWNTKTISFMLKQWTIFYSGIPQFRTPNSSPQFSHCWPRKSQWISYAANISQLLTSTNAANLPTSGASRQASLVGLRPKSFAGLDPTKSYIQSFSRGTP